MTWTPTSAGSYIKFSGAADAEKNNLIDSAKSGTPTFASGDVTVPIDTGETITNLFRNTTAATFYGDSVTGIDVVDTGGLQGDSYLQGDGTNLNVEFPAVTMARGDTMECDYIHDSTGSNQYMWDALTNSNRFYTRVNLNTNAFSIGGSLWIDGVEYGVGNTGTATLVDGQAYHIKEVATAVGSVGTLFSRYGGVSESYGIMGNVIITQPAGTIEYDLNNVTDNGDGTGTVLNTGTNTGHGSATVYNFVAATDIVAVPNNTFSYDLSEGTGTTLGSTPSGKDITLVNSPTWS